MSHVKILNINNLEQMGVLELIRSKAKIFEADPNQSYTEHEALILIGAAISKGSLLQQKSFLVRDTYHAIWKMIDLGFRTTAMELAQELIPQAAWHQQFSMAQEMCGQLVYHFYLYGDIETAEKFDVMYTKYEATVSCEYQAKKLYSQAIYNHKHNLPIDVPELMQLLDSIREKLEHDSLWYQYYYYQCKTLMFEGDELEALLKEAITYFEDAYYSHTSFISIFTKYLIEYYLEIDQREVARILLESKLPRYEIGSIPWYRFMMTYCLILIDDGEISKAIGITQKVKSNSKYDELPEDRRLEWNVILDKCENIISKKTSKDRN